MNILNLILSSELIRNQTLKFLSKTLPILKADDTLPKVTQVVDKNFNENDLGPNQRTFDDDDDVGGHDLSDEDLPHPEHLKQTYQNHKYEVKENEEKEEVKNVTEKSEEEEEEKKSRKKRSTERKSRGFCDGGGVFCALYRAVQGEPINSQLIAERREETGPAQPPPRYDGPPTPCPAKVEYGKKKFSKERFK